METFEAIMNSSIRLMVPLLLAALGELISERAGVLNIGLEGFMTAGAFTAFSVAIGGWGLLPAIALGAVLGAAVAGLMAMGAVWLRGNGILIGFALFVMIPGLANFLYVQQGNQAGTPPLGKISIPLLDQIPVVGPVFFSQNVFYWIAVVSCIAVYLLFTRTRIGLIITATGDRKSVV